jgi:glycosyltransferase involved in cell wall biosynthesis
MRILKVTQTYAPFLEHGGPPVKVRALAQGLARRGHRVTVLTPDWGISGRGGGERTSFGYRREENGVEAIYLSTRLHYRTVTWNPAAGRFCRERLSEFGVVHIYGLYDLLGPRVADACRSAGLPYVVEPIGMYVPIVRNVWLKRAYHEFLGRRMISGARAVVATSEQEAGALIAGGVDRSRLVLRRNGIELPANFPPPSSFRDPYGIPADVKLVLFLGRLVSKKSPDLLLRAFARLSGDEPGKRARLVFAGPDEGTMTKELKEHAQQLGVRERVHFTGALFDEAKWAAYRDADVFVLPSQNENFGNAAAEAVAAGTPVIVTESCGIAELLADGAAVVVPHEEAALADALQRVLRDKALRERMREAGVALIPRLGWDEPLDEMERLYESVARCGSASDKLQFGV